MSVLDPEVLRREDEPAGRLGHYPGEGCEHIFTMLLEDWEATRRALSVEFGEGHKIADDVAEWRRRWQFAVVQAAQRAAAVVA